MTQSAGTDFAATGNEFQLAKYTFILSPTQWDRYEGPQDLQWACVVFGQATLATIPESPGVYAFCVRPQVGGELCGSYLLYIGKTNKLRRRCGEYLSRGAAGNERPRIQRMLNRFSGTKYLHFCFSEVVQSETEAVETSLLEVCLPPGCPDLPASVRRAVDAFGRS